MNILIEKLYHFHCGWQVPAKNRKPERVVWREVRIWVERRLTNDEQFSVPSHVTRKGLQRAAVSLLKAFKANAVEVKDRTTQYAVVAYKDWP